MSLLYVIASVNKKIYNYSKRHNKFLFPSLVETIYESFYKAENEIFNVVNYNRKIL